MSNTSICPILMNTPRVVIFNDTHGWHSEQLTQAFAKLKVETVLTDLALCRIDLDSPTGLFIPGFKQRLPDAALVRGIAPGTFEQITLRMDVLHTLLELGVPVFNPASAIEHTVDKARTSLKLHLAGITTPATWACENKKMAFALAKEQLGKGLKLVAKPLFGCQGKGISLISTLSDLENYQPIGHSFYLQQYIEPQHSEQWQDWRLFVVDNQVCAAMSRRSLFWITNFARGAQCFPTTVSAYMEKLAIDATRAVQAEYAGVDLIHCHDGQYSVLEVNSVPAWKGLYQATQHNIAHDLTTALCRRMRTIHSSHVI